MSKQTAFTPPLPTSPLYETLSLGDPGKGGKGGKGGEGEVAKPL